MQCMNGQEKTGFIETRAVKLHFYYKFELNIFISTWNDIEKLSCFGRPVKLLETSQKNLM